MDCNIIFKSLHSIYRIGLTKKQVSNIRVPVFTVGIVLAKKRCKGTNLFDDDVI